MRDYYKDGFDLKEWQPVKEVGGRVIVEGILPSDFQQIVKTDHLNEMKHCKVWKVVATSDHCVTIKPHQHVVVLKAAIDGVDPSTPKLGVLDSEDICAVIKQVTL